MYNLHSINVHVVYVQDLRVHIHCTCVYILFLVCVCVCVHPTSMHSYILFVHGYVHIMHMHTHPLTHPLTHPHTHTYMFKGSTEEENEKNGKDHHCVMSTTVCAVQNLHVTFI